VFVKGNVEGVDSVFELSDGTKVFVESKVISGGTGLLDEQILKRLEMQFYKHLVTKVLPLVRQVGDNEYVFAGGKAPILDYHIAGSWMTPDRMQKILERFSETMKDPRLEKILKADPELTFDGANIMSGELIPSVIN
jgi:hypothetical protein